MTDERWKYFRVVLAAILAISAIAILVGLAQAKDKGQWEYASPDVHEYFNTLKQPDNVGSSCCGEGDVYYADKTDFAPDGSVIAIITDERADEPLKRAHIPVGTRIPVPPSKIRKVPIPNPTGHTIIFIGIYGDKDLRMVVYCYEPQALF